MSRFTGFLIGVLICVLLVWAAGSHAATPLPPAPAQGWCYDTTGVYGYNGVRGCPNTPPPPDPGAYPSLSVTWYSYQYPNGTSRTVTNMDYMELVGRIYATDTPLPWPGASPTFSFYANPNGYARLHVHITPGVRPRTLVTNSYHGALHGVPLRAAIVAPGAPWPTGARAGCFSPSQIENDGVLLTFGVGLGPNASWCQIPVTGGDYDVLIGFANLAQRGPLVLSWH